MIQHISATNFKAFEKQDFELRPLTLFLGPNNSGKSSVLAGIRILSQTTSSYDPNVAILLNGISGDFGTYKDIVYHNNTKRHLEIDICIKVVKPHPFAHVKIGNRIDLSLKYKYRSSLREIVLNAVQIEEDQKNLLASEYSEDSSRQLIKKLLEKNVPSSIRSAISKDLRMRNFLPYYYGFIERNKEETQSFNFLKKLARDQIRKINDCSSYIYYQMKEVDYIGAMRVPPARTYLFSGERRDRIGSSGENCSNILAMDTRRKGSRTKNIKEQMVEWLKRAEIASDVRIDTISDRHFEIKIQHPTTHEYQNFADVGYGNSQVIPVLVGGFNLEKGNIYLVEEPEIHLHPKAQAELGNFFLSLYKTGIQSIVETHSEYLVIRLQQLIADKKIEPEDFVVYYIHAENDKKKVSKLEIDEKGRFIQEWPKGFFPERLEEAKELSKARHRNRTNS